jgi:hypothetical protein
MTTKLKQVSLEKVAKEKLRKQTVCDINSIEIEVWEKTEPGLFFKISQKTAEFRLIIRISTRKMMAWLSFFIATTAGVVSILKWLTPILTVYFSRPPP